MDVPDHAHYTLGTVILLVGLTGMLGNLMVIYTFCRCLIGETRARALRAASHAEMGQECCRQLRRALLSLGGDTAAKPSVVSGQASFF